MNIPKISVLVPVYNVEPYLQRCIDSVLNQDFTDWELILVDDGSPDRCPEICDEYAQKDERIRVVHKENGGLPSARLAGLKLARGEYILHLDSDDWLAENCISTLYKHTIGGNYDIVRGQNYRVKENGDMTIESNGDISEIVGSENYLKHIIADEFPTYLWGALYRKSLFRAEVFNELKDIAIGEDYLTNISIWKGVERMLFVKDIVYNYFINTQSMMQKQVMSDLYCDRERAFVEYYTREATQEILQMVEDSKMRSYTRQFFVPEIPFNWTHYKQLKEYIKNTNNRFKLFSKVNKRYSYFVNHSILYYMYTRLYCLLFKWLKLHGAKRRVLI